MRRATVLGTVLVGVLCGASLCAQDEWSRWTGAVTVGRDKGDPQLGVSYTLAEWAPQRWKTAAFELPGLMDIDGFALGVGFRFPEVDGGGGVALRTTLGPCWWVPREGGGGLAGGELRLLVGVKIRRNRED